ncbi:MAG: hypothetical protein ACXW3D_10510 [Caulobacteraceae bacterium]
MLRIGILGRHPQLESSFNGVMSFYEALAFAELGCHVTLLLPHSDHFQPRALLEKLGLQRFDQLELGDRIDIAELRETSQNLPRFDALIWQSYRVEDEVYHEVLRPRTTIISKNFPRFYVGDRKLDRRISRRTAARFDLVAFALEEDFTYLQGANFFKLDPSGFAWTGRGCSPEWLNPSLKTAEPSIGFDRAIRPADGGAGAVAHIKAVVERLRFKIPELRTFQMGREPLFPDTKLVGGRYFQRYYDDFLNPCWLYLSIDFAHSLHNQNLHVRPGGVRVYKDLFENQFIEAQMSGGVLAACANETPAELFAPYPASVAYSEHEAIDEICEGVERVFTNFAELSRQAREYAISRYHYRLMGERWLAAFERRLADMG